MWRIWLLFDPRRTLIALFTFLFALALLGAGEWTRRKESVSALPALPIANIPAILTAAGTAVAIGPAVALEQAVVGLLGGRGLAVGPAQADLAQAGAVVEALVVAADRADAAEDAATVLALGGVHAVAVLLALTVADGGWAGGAGHRAGGGGGAVLLRHATRQVDLVAGRGGVAGWGEQAGNEEQGD